MRFLGVLGVLCFMATPAVAVVQSYHMPIDEATSSMGLSLTIGGQVPYDGITATGADSSAIGGMMHVLIDEDAETAELLGFDAVLTEGMNLTINLAPFDPYLPGDFPMPTLGWVTLDTSVEGLEPLALRSTGSGGAVPYDGSGNITFPDVDMVVTGEAWLTGDGTRMPAPDPNDPDVCGSFLEWLVGVALGLGDDGIAPGGELISLTGSLLEISMTEDLPSVLDPDGSVGGGPTLGIDFAFGGEEVLGTMLVIEYGVDGSINAIPEPVSASLLALGGIGMLLRHRR